MDRVRVPRSTGRLKRPFATHWGHVILGFSNKPLSRTRLLQKLYEFVFQILFLSGCVFGLVFSRRACYRLVPGLSIPVFSPSDKRGKVGSRNRGLEIAIRADNRRFHREHFAVKGDGLCEAG